MNAEYSDRPMVANTATALLAEATDGLTRLEKSIEGLAERLSAALGPAEEQPMVDSITTQSPIRTSELVNRVHDLMDTARRLTIRVDKLTQRVEL